MNPFQKQRKYSKWKRKIVEWEENDGVYLSVVFSWHALKAVKRVRELLKQGKKVRVGGPAVAYRPHLFDEVATQGATVGGTIHALPRHHPDATFTTRGCIRNCKFCIVPKVEGDLIELDDWETKPIICDNNLLAASRRHFDIVIDRLKSAGITGVDFNQGLDARLLTSYHANRFTEIDFKCIRLAWDYTPMESQFMRAYEILRRAGIPKSKINVYILIGFGDTPEDALYRLQTVRDLGSYPNPMRYQPIDADKKNSYVDPCWTDDELKRYMRYWANLRYTRNIPFEEFDNKYRRGGREKIKGIHVV